MRLFILLVLLTNFTFSQNTNTKTLIDQKTHLIEEIELSKKMLNSAQKQKNLSIEELKALIINIELRENLKQTIILQKDSIEIYKKEIEKKIQETEEKKEIILSSYKKLIQLTYFNEFETSFLYFIFSTPSFKDALSRYIYYKNQENLRQDLLYELEFLKQQLILFKEDLDLGISLKETLINEFNAESDSLALLKKEQERITSQLTNRETELINYINEKKTEAKKIEDEIIKIQKELAMRHGNTEEQGLAFQNNKGQLIWPVEKGILISNFGEVYHKDLPGIKLINNGIEIGVERGAKVRAVYNGVVSKILIMQNGLKAIMLRHGTYLTVYANLKNTNVNIGQKVLEGEFIGVVFSKKENDTGVLDFQIWKGLEKINPINWIKSN